LLINIHRVPKKTGSQALGGSRGGLSTKLHVAIDALENLVRVILAAGQVADIACASELIADLAADAVIGDKGHDANTLVEQIHSSGTGRHSASLQPPISAHLRPYFVASRNLIERFFNRLKHFRRVATRYDKLACNFMVFVQLACTFLRKP
jgi:transposase